MSDVSDLRAAYEMALARAEAAEQREAQEHEERNHYAEIASRVVAAEAQAAAQAKLVAAMTSTQDPLSPMAVLAKVSEERDAAVADRCGPDCGKTVERLEQAELELEQAYGRIAELEKEAQAKE